MFFATRRKMGAEAAQCFAEQKSLVLETQGNGIEGRVHALKERISDLKARLDVYYSTTFFGKLVKWFDGRRIKWLGKELGGLSLKIEECVKNLSELKFSAESTQAQLIESKKLPSVKSEKVQKAEKQEEQLVEVVQSVDEQVVPPEPEVPPQKGESPAPSQVKTPPPSTNGKAGEEPPPVEEKKPQEPAQKPPVKKENAVITFFKNLVKK